MVSIIIPVYNSEKYLEECLESVINQTYKDFEVLLVDDGSIDSSGEICDCYVLKDSRFKVFHRANEGVSAARNFALDIAQGEYIAFVDSDDVVDEHFIEFLIGICVENQADIAYCDSYDFESQTPSFDIKDNRNVIITNFDSTYALQNFYDTWMNPVIWNKLVKRALFEDLRFPHIQRAEDFWMVMQLITRAERIVGGKGAKLYFYRCDNISAMSTITVKSLCDFEVRLQIYNLLNEHQECHVTKKKLAQQTLRFYLDFLLIPQYRVLEYRKFYKDLKGWGRKLVREMFFYEIEEEKWELVILYASPFAYKWLRLIQHKLINRSLY